MDILKVLQGTIKALVPTQWSGKHNGTPLDKVEVMDCGLNLATQQVWVKARFVEGGVEHTLMGKMPVLQVGQQGGADVIQEDGTTEPNSDVVAGLQFKFAFPPVVDLVVAYKFGTNRYEFSGQVPTGLL